MKQIYFSRLLVIATLLFVGGNANVFAQTTVFSYTGGVQSYTVGPGVISLAIDMYGAGGGKDYYSSSPVPGKGGRVQCILAVTPGQILNVYVGGKGPNGVAGVPGVGGFNGGGNTTVQSFNVCGPGGGASDIRVNSTALSARVVVAGGGGGVGSNGTTSWNGGDGGGLTGASAANSISNYAIGGSQTTGGTGNFYSGYTSGSNGVLGIGGDGSPQGGSAAGGGGYYGGGGGCWSGGAGGSNYASASLCTSVTHTQGYTTATGNGQVSITVLCTAPGTISGTTTLCAGSSFTLSETSTGGTWSSSAPGIASIDPTSGVLTGVSSGTASITYNLANPCGGVNASTTVTVKASPAPTFTGYTGPICSDVIANISNAVSGGTWTTSDPGVAPINSSGVLTPAASGVATISYTLSSGCYATLPVTIKLAPKPISGSNFVCTGAANAVLLSDAVAGGVWSSSNASATVNSTSGLVTGIATGTPFITYTIPSGGCFVTLAMNVNVQPAPITGSTAVCVGNSISLNNISVGGTWTSSNPYQASVTPGAGFVSGVAVGNPVISYTLPGGCSSTATVVVNPVPNPLLMSSAPKLCVGQVVNVTSAELNGLWSSSNTSVATVDANSGDITGVAGGTAGIAYTFTATGCSTTLNAVVNILPTVFTVGGGGGYCQGGSGMHVTLSNSQLGATYDLFNDNTGIPIGTQSGTASSLDFGAWSPSALTTYTVVATSPAGCKQDMSGAAVITVNPLPSAFNLLFTGLSAYCSGGTGVHLKLDSSQSGVNYRANNAGVLGPVVPGTGSGALDLGLYTAGSYFIEATDGVTGCKNTMNNIQTVTANSLPTVYPVISTSPSTAYCAGGAGVDVSLPNSQAGITYTLMRNSVFVTAVTAVSSGALPFGGNQKVAGNYTIIAVDSTAGCSSNMSGSVNVSINPLPVIQTVSGGGDYCLGSGGKHVNLLNSAGGVKYILKADGVIVDSATGSNSGLDFGAKTVGGTYTVIAVDALGCQNTMSGSAVITPKGLPNIYSVTGGGPFCSGDTGVHVKLFGYDLGVRYQLYRNGISVGSQKTGLGSGVDFGLVTIPGNYTVVALNPATTCTNNMANPVTVSINPLPDVHTVLGGGAFCAGDPNGVCVKLIPGDAGIDYTLYGNGVAQATKTGTGDTLYFCNVTIPGTYTIIAVNSSTTCSRNMTGSTIVKVNALPVNYKVTGGGDFCAGGPGLPIGDSLSASGVEYTLLESGNPVGPVLGGTGTALNFGLFGQGTYTIRAKNLVTGCTNTGGSASIVMHALPAVHNVSGSAVFCEGDSRNITLDNSDTTASYQLYNGTTMSGTAMAGVNGTLDFGSKTTSGRYTVIATDTANHCTNAMNDTAVLQVNKAPDNFAVTLAASSRCAFDTPGIRMDLHGSQLATNYQVLYGASPDGFFAGTGLPIFLGYHKGAGSYTVVATNPVTGCTTTMTDIVNISIRSTNPTADSIYIVGGDAAVCSGLPVTLKSVPTNPGTAPVYVWKVNGTAAGSDTMLTYVPSPGDVVTAIMKSNEDCAFPASATSKPIALDVKLSALPTTTVTASAVSPVCPGTKITFTASSNFEGADPHYGWIVNGIPAGTDSRTFSITPTDSMVVFVQLMSSYTCRTADYVLSNDLPYAINEPVLPILSIDALTPATVNKGEAVTLRAVVANRGKTAFTYQWYVHGVAQTGETNPTFTHNYYLDNEDVKVVVTSHNTCGDLSTSESMLIRVRGNAGVQHVSTGGDVRVVPNPSKGTFTVKGNLGNTADEEVTLELTNMLGQVVYSSQAMSHGGNINEQVQLNGNIASGMYILNLRSGSSHEVFHVVIEQ